MTLKPHILGNSKNPLSNGSHAVELEYRLPALTALYQTQCRVALSAYNFGVDIRSLISRGGHIHYVLGPDNAILGFASVLNSRSLLENIFPVERFIVDTALSQDVRQEVADTLIQSIIEQARTELPCRYDDIWVRVSFPSGADALNFNQPVFTALELNGFQASRTPGMVSWTAWLQRAHGAASEAA